MAKDDLASLLARFAKVPKAVRRAVEPALDKGADEIVAMAKYLAPSDDGDLKRSVRKEPGAHPLERIVAAGDAKTADYVLGQEFGNVHVPKQAFFYPAVRLKQKTIRRRIARAVGKAVRDEWAK